MRSLPVNRRQLLTLTGAGITVGTIGISQVSAKSNPTIELYVNGATSTGIPPMVNANIAIDISALDDSDFSGQEDIQIQLENEDTNEQLWITPEEEIVSDLIEEKSLGLSRLTKPTAEIKPEDPKIRFGLDEVAVNVSGDMEIFRNDSTLATYRCTILDGEAPLFETQSKKFGTQFPPGLVQTAAGEKIEYTLPQHDLGDVDVELEFVEVLEQGGRNEIIEPFERQGDKFVAEVDQTALTDDGDVDFRSIDAHIYSSGAEFVPESKLLIIGANVDREQAPAVYETTIDSIDESVEAGEEITVEYTVANIGEATGWRLSDVYLFVEPMIGTVSRDYVASDQIGELEPDGKISGTFSYTTTEEDIGLLDVRLGGDGSDYIADFALVRVEGEEPPEEDEDLVDAPGGVEIPSEYVDDNGEVGAGELLDAGTDFKDGEVDPDTLLDVGTAFQNS